MGRAQGRQSRERLKLCKQKRQKHKTVAHMKASGQVHFNAQVD